MNYKTAIELFELVKLPYAFILEEGTLDELLEKCNPDIF
jgi:hypothetical protein